MNSFRAILSGLLLMLACAASATAQPRIAFPTAYPGTVYQNPPAPAFTPPAFDPYGSGAGTAPALAPAPGSGFMPPAANPYAAPPAGYGIPPYGVPPAGAPGAFPPQQPGSIFPNGFPTFGFDQSTGWAAAPPPYQRLFDNTGITYAWLNGGGDGNEMEVNEIDIRTTMNIPGFLGSQYPLLFTPGFTFTLTDGPSFVPADVPGALYAAYGDFGWFPRLTPAVGADLDVRVGVYSDFQSFTSHSIRITGIAAADIVLTPTLRAKVGVNYIDRADLKLFPYVGVVYKPNDFAQWDLIFPSPRVSYYLTTIGAHNTAMWGYVGGEYGGGSWTVERTTAPIVTEQMDYNDIRIYAGLEWRCVSPGGPRGFFEAGYVFDRRLIYTAVPADNLSLKDTVMLRTGFRF